jgi:CubicO group peptidase (beta-lactamase class C family)
LQLGCLAALEAQLLQDLACDFGADWAPEDKWNRIATLYDAGPNGQIVKATDEAQEGDKHKPVFMSGAGGLASTATDYARFAQMLLNQGEPAVPAQQAFPKRV